MQYSVLVVIVTLKRLEVARVVSASHHLAIKWTKQLETKDAECISDMSSGRLTHSFLPRISGLVVRIWELIVNPHQIIEIKCMKTDDGKSAVNILDLLGVKGLNYSLINFS